MDVPEKACKSRFIVLPMICGSGWSKSRLAKAAGAEPAGQMRDEKLHTLVGEAHFQVKMYKARKLQTSLEVAMSKKCTQLWRAAHFQVKSQECKKLTGWSHFWKLRCRKSEPRCGTKRISM